MRKAKSLGEGKEKRWVFYTVSLNNTRDIDYLLPEDKYQFRENCIL